jgi:hypothetical protein
MPKHVKFRQVTVLARFHPSTPTPAPPRKRVHLTRVAAVDLAAPPPTRGGDRSRPPASPRIRTLVDRVCNKDQLSYECMNDQLSNLARTFLLVFSVPSKGVDLCELCFTVQTSFTCPEFTFFSSSCLKGSGRVALGPLTILHRTNGYADPMHHACKGTRQPWCTAESDVIRRRCNRGHYKVEHKVLAKKNIFVVCSVKIVL